MSIRSTVITKYGIPLRCHRCKHEWVFGGKNDWYATCPNCRTYTSIVRNTIQTGSKAGTTDQSVSSTKGFGVPNPDG